MMETVSDLDLELIFSLGLPFEQKCEHSQHSNYRNGHSDSSNLSYVRVGLCGSGAVKVMCDTYLEHVKDNFVACARCDELLSHHYTVLGPVE